MDKESLSPNICNLYVPYDFLVLEKTLKGSTLQEISTWNTTIQVKETRVEEATAPTTTPAMTTALDTTSAPKDHFG